MVKMHNLRRTATDVKAEKSALGKDSEHAYVPPEDDGARFELEHHHLTKMGIGGDLKSGDALHFHGHGTVEKSESRSSPEGERHSATIRFHHGAVEHEAGDEAEGRKGLRNELEQVHGKVEEKAGLKAARSDKKIPEKTGGK
jgi:hypothetical protein